MKMENFSLKCWEIRRTSIIIFQNFLYINPPDVVKKLISCFIQNSIVSWSVSRETSLDLLTVGNLTFSGDPRHSILRQRHNDWVLVIQSVSMEDSGTYICTVQTYPPQNIMVNVKVLGKQTINVKECKVMRLEVWLSKGCTRKKRYMCISV